MYGDDANMNSFDWDGLRFFITAAEAGSLTAAAKSLGTNQPTVGRQIDSLEQQLGLKLFQRSVKGLLLTEEGARLLEQSRAIQAQFVRLERALSGDPTISGTVRLALPEGLCLEVLTPRLPEFYAAHPDIRLILNVSANSADLTRGEADMAVRLYRPSEVSLVVKKLGDMPMGLFASKAYLKGCAGPASVSELARHRVIAYGDRLAGLEENHWLLAHSSPELQVLRSDSTSTRLRATLAGVGISVQPKRFSRSNPQLQQVLADVVLPAHEMWLVYHKDLREIERVRALAKFIVVSLADA